jgi:hypothetical protein
LDWIQYSHCSWFLMQDWLFLVFSFRWPVWLAVFAWLCVFLGRSPWWLTPPLRRISCWGALI